jgi:hypothetical protein
MEEKEMRRSKADWVYGPNDLVDYDDGENVLLLCLEDVVYQDTIIVDAAVKAVYLGRSVVGDINEYFVEHMTPYVPEFPENEFHLGVPRVDYQVVNGIILPPEDMAERIQQFMQQQLDRAEEILREQEGGQA